MACDELMIFVTPSGDVNSFVTDRRLPEPTIVVPAARFGHCCDVIVNVTGETSIVAPLAAPTCPAPTRHAAARALEIPSRFNTPHPSPAEHHHRNPEPSSLAIGDRQRDCRGRSASLR